MYQLPTVVRLLPDAIVTLVEVGIAPAVTVTLVTKTKDRIVRRNFIPLMVIQKLNSVSSI